MTPPATASARSTAHRAAPARRTVVRHPRRISGPARAIAAASAPAVALPRAPARRRSATRDPGLALRALDALARIYRSALLDRLIRSRIWIGVLAFSLMGIVAMQLLVLKLNTDVGRVLAREAALQRENALMAIEGSKASAGDLVEPTAAAAGMTIAPPGSLRFVAVSSSDVSRAASVLSAPVAASQPSEAPASASAQSSETATPSETASSEARSSETASSETASNEARSSEAKAALSASGSPAASSSEAASSASSSSSSSTPAASASGGTSTAQAASGG